MRKRETASDRAVLKYYEAIGGASGLLNLEEEYSRGERVAPSIGKLIRAQRNLRVLDLCCGYGRIALPLSKMGCDVSGIDILPDMIRQAKKNARTARRKIAYRIGDMRALPYEDGSFDRIICLWNSFNHLLLRSEQKMTLREAERALAPGGRAYFEVMNGGVEPYRSALKRRPPIFRDTYTSAITLYMHDQRRLEELATAAGIRKFRTFFRRLDGRNKLFLEIQKPRSA